MTGLWLVSYLILWVLVVALTLLLVGVLRQLGMLYRQLALQPAQAQAEEEDSIPALEQDGPAIGSPLADLELDTVNAAGKLTTTMLLKRGPTLLVFLSPMCETCQHIVEPLNTQVADAACPAQPVVIMRADQAGCRAFLSVFPLRMPVVCDQESDITVGFGVHRSPFGLLYDEQGTLVRKGVLEGREDLLALLGSESATPSAQDHIFPRLVSSKAP
jgi:methylamine dehydrogenase accessory protein MauD